MKKKTLLFIIGGSVFALLVIISAIILIVSNNGTKNNNGSTVTITFDVDGGKKIEPMKVKKDEKVKLPGAQKEGFSFVGWYFKDKKLDSEVAFSSDTTVKAKWEEISKDAKTVKLVFDTGEGDPLDSMIAECDKALTELPIPTYKGYDFISWSDKHGKIIGKGSKLTCDSEEVTLTANWEAKELTFKMTFDSNGGSKVDPITVKCDTELTMPANPTKEGYTFVRWEDKNGTPILNKAKLTCEDITVKAVWEKVKQYKCPDDTYKKSTDANGKVICTSTGTVKSEECPTGTKADGNICINLNDKGTKHEENSVISCDDSSYQYYSSSDIATKFNVQAEDGCYKKSSKVKTCHEGYTLKDGVCTKTVDATEV